jgi:hypothetical protein
MRWLSGVYRGVAGRGQVVAATWRAVSRRRFGAGLLAVCLGGFRLSAADTVTAPEFALKAAYLCSFAEFAVWPEKAFEATNSPIILGILGDDPFGAALDKVAAGRSVNGRVFQIRRLKAPAGARECHLLFVAPSEMRRLPEVLALLDHAPVLTVGDADRFGQRGGMINLRLEGKKLKFEINLTAAERAALKIKAQFLKLGTIVETGPPAGR